MLFICAYAERKHAVSRRSVGGGRRRAMESAQTNSNASSDVSRLQATCVRLNLVYSSVIFEAATLARTTFRRNIVLMPRSVTANDRIQDLNFGDENV